MGREARCPCQWGAESADCKVLLETHELIVRGSIRRRIAIASISQVSLDGDQLRFRVGEDHVVLSLGAGQAQRWAKAISTPPPTLAVKLGISAASCLTIVGELDSKELRSAVLEAAPTNGKVTDLILAQVRTMADLNYLLDRYRAFPSDPPIWIIYVKGRNEPLAESDVRSTMRSEGFIDTKVASVSTTLTALRFIKRS
jgi:hypothetical protein